MVWKARDRDSGMGGVVEEWWWHRRRGGLRVKQWPPTGVGVDSSEGVCVCVVMTTMGCSRV